MLAYARSSIAYETSQLHPVLFLILREVADSLWFEYTHQENVVVTDIMRTHADTVRIYRAAGLEPPASSVHELGRGVDLSVRAWRPGERYENWPFLPSSVVRDVVKAINKRWRYQESDAHQVALFHSVAGAHLHLQVRPGTETVRRAV